MGGVLDRHLRKRDFVRPELGPKGPVVEVLATIPARRGSAETGGMTTVTTVALQRDHAGPDEWVSPRLPDIIDGWVRDGLLSAHTAMKVFSPTNAEPSTRERAAAASHVRFMQVLGYVGAGIVTLGGLLILFDDRVGLGTRFLVGILIMIAMGRTMRPATAARRTNAAPPRHRRVRHTVTRGRS